uniref:Uncharacterized protein n=1 Tax=Acrobeloides nanus TaxID=290746 RepID=A0A914DER0_9BILA
MKLPSFLKQLPVDNDIADTNAELCRYQSLKLVELPSDVYSFGKHMLRNILVCHHWPTVTIVFLHQLLPLKLALVN